MDNQNDIISNRHTEFSSRTVFNGHAIPTPLVKEVAGESSKIDKIITALFLVTDIIDKNEPLRIRLRDVGLNVLTDTRLIEPSFGQTKLALSLVSEIVSLINIAKSIKLISEMNSSILIREFTSIVTTLENKIEMKNSIENIFSGGEQITTPIPLVHKEGVKASPPFQGGDGRGGNRDDGVNFRRYTDPNPNTKNARKELIIKLIKDQKEVTTKDIALGLRNLGEDKGEKTIQRELISLMEQGLIKKSGEKRWSKYSLI